MSDNTHYSKLHIQVCRNPVLLIPCAGKGNKDSVLESGERYDPLFLFFDIATVLEVGASILMQRTVI